MTVTAQETRKLNPLVEISHLKQYFPIKGGIFGQTINYVKAVDDISFTIYEGETLSIVGESGCGKSTTGRAILRLDEPTAGEIHFRQKDVLALGRSELRKLRKEMQVIFQDPFASLNPRQTVRQILGEALAVQNVIPRDKRPERIKELLAGVGLRPDHIDRYPHEFSGGQRQRIGIARALAVEPKLIVCDEAVSALDVSIQAQVLNLLKHLQSEYKLTYLFISHDLGVVRHISDRVAVMYLGKIVEIAEKTKLFENPQHPYTKALLSSIPAPGGAVKKERILLTGDVPSPINPPQGCRFHTRCPQAAERCKHQEPALRRLGEDHQAACHLLDAR
ncbi:ABC transporter ATP-binding protein [Paenibacillus thalictri]|uniref:Dipeptide ABC transporter ATP-binding protein n=1 Tax=Paenibacillus thalictri TaxID=2527873 RepID=A0A4Q9DLH0_9BACL|nr:dipeptide ABC transporter ATP-binding protein [Paenibacillus thalictri]TBL73315.1 dipeptide ABC transporter ATP-binding protein [Paenibacillus thalictri]